MVCRRAYGVLRYKLCFPDSSDFGIEKIDLTGNLSQQDVASGETIAYL